MRKFFWLIVSVLAVTVAQNAQADGLPIIPITGFASFQDDWFFSLSGPSLSLAGGQFVDSSTYRECTPTGTVCDLSATINADTALAPRVAVAHHSTERPTMGSWAL